ncbi:MAG: nucleotidyl transferase AbiEii/AbiGii toxin family protein, partial [Kiritimatiellaeota bacterium]|nr:nucleotidyl transferase AbiEii/AbiGii toxin family protein [Kiritimatiellota bacterium]
MNGVNWENSKALTALKKDFLQEFFAVEKRFFLTGGSALGIFYFDHRLSYDLDFFTTESDVEWKPIEGKIRDICERINAEYEPVTRSPSFQRFQMRRGAEKEIIDFVIEWV